MFAEDLTLFFNTAEHATEATWSRSPDPISVIFDDGFADALGISSSNPTATAIAAHMPNVAHGDTLLIKGVNYRIEDVQPDGTGVLTLPLKKS